MKSKLLITLFLQLAMFELNKSSITNAKFITEELGISDVTRGLLIVLTATMVIMGFIGNLTVLISSLKYKAIELDKIDLIFLENIAAADFILTLFGFVPMFTTLCGNTWILGNFLCRVNAFVINIPAYSEILLIMFTSCYRMWRISCPLSVPMRSKTIKILVSVIWVVSVSVEFVPAFIPEETVAYYEPLYLQCRHSARPIYNAGILTLILAPLVVIVIANVVIFIMLRKSDTILTKNGLKGTNSCHKAAVTILSICAIFIISYAPFILLFLYHLFRTPPNWLLTLCQYSITLNVVMNPVIYTLTNKRFGKFVRRFVLKTGRRISENITHSHNSAVYGVNNVQVDR